MLLKNQARLFFKRCIRSESREAEGPFQATLLFLFLCIRVQRGVGQSHKQETVPEHVCLGCGTAVRRVFCDLEPVPGTVSLPREEAACSLL